VKSQTLRASTGYAATTATSTRQPLLVAGTSAALLVAILVSLAVGRYSVPIDHVTMILLSPLLDLAPSWTPTEELVVWTIRLPRTLMAGVAGAGLALSGATLQGIFRNPLVGPQTIGIASGAAMGGVAAILLYGFGISVTAGAFLGAIAALIAVLTIHRSDSISPTLTLVLAGVVVGAFCSALVGFATFVADPETKLPGIVFWLLGSFATATWPRLMLISLCVVTAGSVLLAMRWRINLLSLGDEEAQSLGARPNSDRLILLAGICLIVAAQVAVSGTVGWVGLVIPNLARMIAGSDHRRLLPVATLLGAIFLIVADTCSRSMVAAEIPVGLVTAVVGTPVFAYLLRRNASERKS
jgi:iron complex transport system permease protein